MRKKKKTDFGLNSIFPLSEDLNTGERSNFGNFRFQIPLKQFDKIINLFKID